MSEKKLDLQELDQILKKNTSELPNPLQGVSFSVFNNKGLICILFHPLLQANFKLLKFFGG